MKRVSVLCLAALICLVSSSDAFDGKRKGFVLGGGLGFSPVAKFTLESVRSEVGRGSEEGAGVAVNLLIGYAIDEHNMLVYEGNVAGWSAQNFSGGPRVDDVVAQGFDGLAFYHYFGPKGKTAFVVLGVGLYRFSGEDWEADPGGGFMLGGGFEFNSHWQIGGYLSSGKTSYHGVDYKHSTLNILVSGIAF